MSITRYLVAQSAVVLPLNVERSCLDDQKEDVTLPVLQQCTICSQTKPLIGNYHKAPRTVTGYRKQCKQCISSVGQGRAGKAQAKRERDATRKRQREADIENGWRIHVRTSGQTHTKYRYVASDPNSIELDTSSGDLVIIDADQFDRVKNHSVTIGHHYHKNTREVIHRRAKIHIEQTTWELSRYILGCTQGDGVVVDHRDRNTLNNRQNNLYKGTSQSNSRNMQLSRNNTTGHAGVTHIASKQLYRVAVYTTGTLKFEYFCYGPRSQHNQEQALTMAAACRQLSNEQTGMRNGLPPVTLASQS